MSCSRKYSLLLSTISADSRSWVYQSSYTRRCLSCRTRELRESWREINRLSSIAVRETSSMMKAPRSVLIGGDSRFCEFKEKQVPTNSGRLPISGTEELRENSSVYLYVASLSFAAFFSDLPALICSWILWAST
jgi:hypothetical protein